MNSEWIRENERRSKYLDYLYKLDGRDDPAHPMHELLTGLFQDRMQRLVELEKNALFPQVRGEKFPPRHLG